MSPTTIQILLTACGLLLSFIFGTLTASRNKSHDDKDEAAQLTTMIVKLENIGSGVNEIKNDIRNVRSEVQELRERLAKVESSTSSAHHRLDTMEGVKERIHND